MRFSEVLTLPPFFHYLYYFNDNQTIKAVKHHKDLGVLVTNNLTWSDHINYTAAHQLTDPSISVLQRQQVTTLGY